MKIAALITWLVTAAGGFYLLGTWLARGGASQQQAGTSRFPAPVIYGHFLLATAGLIVWIAYLAAGTRALAWAGFAILLPVALLGFTMFARWLGVYRGSALDGRADVRPGQPASGRAPTATAPAVTVVATPAERHLPVAVVLAHGLLAATTLVLVLLAAIGVGTG